MGIIVAGIFISFSFSSFTIFESLERIIYSVEMRLDLPQNVRENRIAIVNIDDKSLKQLGPWPWPRRTIAEMITILKNNGDSYVVGRSYVPYRPCCISLIGRVSPADIYFKRL